MSNFDFPKKLLSKKIKIITTSEGNFFCDFYEKKKKTLHYVVSAL